MDLELSPDAIREIKIEPLSVYEEDNDDRVEENGRIGEEAIPECVIDQVFSPSNYEEVQACTSYEPDLDDTATTDAALDDPANLDSDHESDLGPIEEDVASDSDEETPDVVLPNWIWRKWENNDSPFPRFKFIPERNTGFIPPDGFDSSSEINFFNLFFTDEFLIQITEETNKYARDKIEKKRPLPPHSAWHSWVDITLTEIKAFIGVIINMSLNAKPEIDDFFSANWLDYQPFFKAVFSKERFFQIFWTLHLSPPPTEDSVSGSLTRSGRVRRVMRYLERKFTEHFFPSPTVSVGESTIGFEGDKPTKWGIKVFVLRDAVSGYVCAMEPYTGAASTANLDRPDLLVTSRIVLALIEKLENGCGNIQGIHVFTDRYYTSVELAKELYLMKIHLTGTVNRNRKGLPTEIRRNPKLKKGDVLSMRRDGISSDPAYVHVLEWKDTRPVTMLTTLYDNSNELVTRAVKGGEEAIEKPSVVCRYNEFMGGVDRHIASYTFMSKPIKWWRKVFFWLLELSIVNSFILCDTNRPPGEKPMRQRNFRKKLIESLVGDFRSSKKRKRPPQMEDEERLDGKLHIPKLLDARKSKDCATCSDRITKGARKRTRMFCDTCRLKPGLHPGECFRRYHTLKKYKAQEEQSGVK